MGKTKKEIRAVLGKIFRGMLYILPFALIFSYYPVMRIGAGSNRAMNFEFSITLFWLVVFDLISFWILIWRKEFRVREFIKAKWVWLVFPIFVTISLFWTENFLRGVLTVGVLWLIYFAIFSFFELKEFLDFKFKKNFLRVFFSAGLFISVWCLVQCILDLVGVSREVSLMCAGCTTEMFGFPHPNGFAIEPQFMGNLLLAPTIFSAYLVLNKEIISGDKILEKKFARILLLFVFAMTLFLTFSRGAIYAFIVAMIFMVAMEVVWRKDFKVFSVVLISGFAFLFTLNLQGIFAQVSKTNDTYLTGIQKVLNHLSLGIIDFGEVDGNSREGDFMTSQENLTGVEKEDSGDMGLEEGKKIGDGGIANDNEAVFDGYVEESTDVRVGLTNSAMRVWRGEFRTVVFGVGIGGAGEALYRAGETGSSKEIVQNEYASLLLETGIIGIILFV
ncbi:MAG: O-antigen ligase family protein, partial [Candidatus Saccharibacteria bacterium]|nr:O-antigen ligase family protein [Candidatus Saccharibacteria bacterium]